MIHQVVTKGQNEIKVLAESPDYNEAFAISMKWESGKPTKVDGRLGTTAVVNGNCIFVESGAPVWIAHTGSGEF